MTRFLISFGGTSSSVQKTLPAAEPSGGIIEDFTVTHLVNASWEISLKGCDCVHNLPLFALHNMDAISNTTSSATYRVETVSGRYIEVEIRRTQTISQPVRGKFDIKWNGRIVKGMNQFSS